MPSTKPIGPSVRAARSSICGLTRTTSRASFAVDPGLIGGAKVQVGDHLVDTSVRAKLDALRIQLAS